MKKYFDLQMFADENLTKDNAPAISIDLTSKFAGNIDELREVLGVTDMEPMASGTTIKIYRMVQVNTPEQVAEGEVIALTQIKQELARTEEITLKKYRKATTAEEIQRVGKNLAINKTDAKLISGVQSEIKGDFYDAMLEGEGTAAGATLQATLANAWGALKKRFADQDVTPIHFVSSDDVADYLGSAQVTMQNAFGMSYIKDFLGLGTLVITPSLDKGKTISTAKENLRGAHVPANSGDVATTFGLTADATGLVGMCHTPKSENASIETLVMAGVKFFPEMIDGVIVGTVGAGA